MFVAYFRVSTDDQDEAMQLDNVQTMVEKMGINWDVVEKIIDHGISGRLVDREGYQKVMNLIKNKEIDMLFIYDYSRIWRNMEEQSTSLKQILLSGTKIYSFRGGNAEVYNAETKLRINLQGVVNEYEADKFKERREDGINIKQKRCAELMKRAIEEGWTLEQLEQHPDFWKGRNQDKNKRKKTKLKHKK